MELLINLIHLVTGIFNVTLFFKVWTMTNDVRKIKNKYLAQDYILTKTEYINKQKEDLASRENGSKFKAGDLVIIKKNENQFRITKVQEKEGVYYYASDNINHSVEYTDDEIELFDEYWRNKK